MKLKIFCGEIIMVVFRFKNILIQLKSQMFKGYNMK